MIVNVYNFLAPGYGMLLRVLRKLICDIDLTVTINVQEYEKGQLDNDESEQTKISPQRSPMRNAEAAVRDPQAGGGGRRGSQDGTQQSAAAEKARMEAIRLEQQEQKRQQELRELQVKAEQEKLVRLREEQLRQEKEREEINRLELERLQQIQEEQRRLEDERRRQEESIRLEQVSYCQLNGF